MIDQAIASRLTILNMSCLIFSRRQSGASVVEILFVVPLLFVILFVILEFTNILRTYQAITWVAEYGIREASDGMEPGSHDRISAASARNIIRDKLIALGVKNVDRNNICVQYSSNNGSSWEPNSTSPCTDAVGSYAAGDLVRVTIQLAYEPFLPRLLVPRPTFGVIFQRVLSR